MKVEEIFSSILINEQRFLEYYYNCGTSSPLAKHWGLLSRLDESHRREQEDILLLLNQVISTVEPVGE